MLEEIFQSPPLWIGLGLLFMIIVYATTDDSQKRYEARLARATRSKPLEGGGGVIAMSLRRRELGADTPIGQLLSTMRSITKLRARLEIAGMAIAPQRFLMYMGVIAVGSAFIMIVMLGKSPLIGILIGCILGTMLPNMAINRKIKKRQMGFLKLFPEAIDLMVRGLRAGLPIAESFLTVSKEIPPPLGDVFATITQQTALGMPMEKALADTALKVDLTEFNFFVTTIILQRETGGNLGEILSNLSEMLRQRHMMKLKIGALSSEARASAMIVGALPFVVFILLELVSPEYLHPLFADRRGTMSLLAAGASMGFGAFVMSKMTQLEI